jgi:rubrerythrin
MDRARRRLVRALQMAHAGELGAIRAYLGHRASLPPGDDREAVRRILVDEIHHRRGIAAMLASLGAAPDPRRERRLRAVGNAISAFCLVGGWFLPMAGAARFERDNVVEYEVVARLAVRAGREDLVERLLAYAEVEWDHERALRERAARHRLWRWFPTWEAPGPRDAIRGRFEAFRARPRSLPDRKSWVR